MNHTFVFVIAAALTAAAPALAWQAEEQSAAQRPTDERVGKLVEFLEPLDLSGYVQARYVWEQESTTEDVTDGFTVRRARLKAVYQLDWSAYQFQIDGSPRGVTLKDAEAHLIEPWTGYRIRLVMGQTKWPFAYEVHPSSSKREFPERSQVIRAFAPGERDRGAKFVADFGVLKVMGGVFDGNGIENREFPGRDNDRYKDVLGRAGFDLKWISGGVSGWYGNTYRPESDDGTLAADTFARNRVGADLQLKGSLLPIGKTELRLEGIRGTTYTRSGREQYGLPAAGWYAVLAQQLGDKTTLALRYDYFDYLLGTEDRASPADPDAPAATNSVTNLGVALLYQWTDHLRLTGAFELPITGGPADPDDSLFILQAQASF